MPKPTAKSPFTGLWLLDANTVQLGGQCPGAGHQQIRQPADALYAHGNRLELAALATRATHSLPEAQIKW
jgi:hypothetical protein